jgi:EmrB/QacA subfamily drug resistance transporter
VDNTVVRAGRGWTLGLVCVVIFMLVLDTTVVMVALPEIQHSLDAGLGNIQWVVDAYTLTLASLLLGAATLGDSIGRRPMFLSGVGLFTSASLACGLAGDALVLDLCRGVQGIGGAVLFGIGVPLIADSYPQGRSRDLAIGLFGAVSGSAVAVGPLLGGLLTELVGWRSIFLINVPVGIVVVALARTRLVRCPGSRSRRIDLVGSLMVTLSLFCFLLGCIEGPREGWTEPWILGAFAGSGLAGAWFVLLQIRSASPLVDPVLFRSRHYTASGIVGVVLQGTVVASTTFLALYAQNVAGFGPLETGLRFLPFSLAAFVSAAAVAPLMARFGSLLLPVTTAVAALGLAWLTRLGVSPDPLVMVPGFVVGGTAVGIGATAINRFAISDVPADRLGMSSGTSTALRQLGVACGVALLGIVHQWGVRTDAMEKFRTVPGLSTHQAEDLAELASTTSPVAVEHVAPPQTAEEIGRMSLEATTHGLGMTLSVAAGTAAVATVVTSCILLAGRRREQRADRRVGRNKRAGPGRPPVDPTKTLP